MRNAIIGKKYEQPCYGQEEYPPDPLRYSGKTEICPVKLHQCTSRVSQNPGSICYWHNTTLSTLVRSWHVFVGAMQCGQCNGRQSILCNTRISGRKFCWGKPMTGCHAAPGRKSAITDGILQHGNPIGSDNPRIDKKNSWKIYLKEGRNHEYSKFLFFPTSTPQMINWSCIIRNVARYSPILIRYRGLWGGHPRTFLTS